MTHEEPTGHRPMYVRWESRHSVPAEVCDTCSDPDAGRWVPVSSCDRAMASTEDPYTYGVLRPYED